MCLKYCCMYGKQIRPWSDSAFAKGHLSQYKGLLRYTFFFSVHIEFLVKVLSEIQNSRENNIPIQVCYEPGVTRKKWKWNQQQALNY